MRELGEGHARDGPRVRLLECLILFDFVCLILFDFVCLWFVVCGLGFGIWGLGFGVGVWGLGGTCQVERTAPVRMSRTWCSERVEVPY